MYLSMNFNEFCLQRTALDPGEINVLFIFSRVIRSFHFFQLHPTLFKQNINVEKFIFFQNTSFENSLPLLPKKTFEPVSCRKN